MSSLSTPCRPLRLHLVVGLALAGVLSACASDAAQARRSAPDTPTDGFPVTLTNCGRSLIVEEPVRRAVSLNQGSTEILLSLGLEDRMVGTATWTDPVLESLAQANESVPRLADQAPSKERLLETAPDFVTASFSNTFGTGGVITPRELTELGVGWYLSPAECLKDNEGDGDGERDGVLEIDVIFREITELAAVFGVPRRGEKLVADLRGRMEQARENAADADVSVLYWFANAESPYMAGCCGAPGIISRTLGLQNVFDDTTEEWPQINWETVAARNPDVLVLGDLTRRSQTADSGAAKIEFLKNNPVTSQMDAVKNERFVLLSGAELNPSIRTVPAIENVAAQLAELGLTK